MYFLTPLMEFALSQKPPSFNIVLLISLSVLFALVQRYLKKVRTHLWALHFMTIGTLVFNVTVLCPCEKCALTLITCDYSQYTLFFIESIGTKAAGADPGGFVGFERTSLFADSFDWQILWLVYYWTLMNTDGVPVQYNLLPSPQRVR